MGRTWTEEQKAERSEQAKARWAEKKELEQAKKRPIRKRQPQGKMAYYVFMNELDQGHPLVAMWQGVRYNAEHGDEVKLPVDFVAYHDETFIPSDKPKEVKINPDDFPEGAIIPTHYVVKQNRFRFVFVRDVEDKRFKDNS